MRQEDEEPVRRLLFFCVRIFSRRRHGGAHANGAPMVFWIRMGHAPMAFALCRPICLTTARDTACAMPMRGACVDAAIQAS
ncbi:hypothetical protein SB85_06735 [Xanthomonas sacchari]|nr:hypothetical protein SB85_06735 [Xanthomonas sacchari]